MRIKIAAVLAALTATACSQGPHLNIAPGEYTTVQRVPDTGLRPPTPADLHPQGRPYLIGPFDKVRIEVFGNPDLSRDLQADSSGRFSYPLLGQVDANGKTPQEVESEIATRLRANHVRDPQVTVNLTESVSQVVTIDGQVVQPGQYPLVGRMTLQRAIAGARGTTEYARQTNVLIFRQVEGQQYVGLYNLAAIRAGLYADPEIYPNDVIVVDEDRARRMFRDLISLAPTLAAPLVAVLSSGN